LFEAELDVGIGLSDEICIFQVVALDEVDSENAHGEIVEVEEVVVVRVELKSRGREDQFLDIMRMTTSHLLSNEKKIFVPV
jgi:hypothetical protein